MSNLVDTSPDAERVLYELARNSPPWRKIEMVSEMYRTVFDLHLAGLRIRHPHAGESELRRMLADVLLGPELAKRAYGP